MRIGVGEAKVGVQPVRQLPAGDMFQFFRDLMYFVPAKLQLFYQKIFPEAVLADDLNGGLFSFIVQLETFVSFIDEQFLLL